jgi:hypothetical protein
MPNPMPLRLVKVNSVAIGTFNMYIVRPAWLVKEGIIPEGTSLKLDIGLDEATTRISVQEPRTQWLVTPSRLMIESDNARENCGKILWEVLSRLPHTPLRALGSNFIFEADASILAKRDAFASFRMLALPRGCRHISNSFRVSLERKSYVFNLDVIQQGEKVTLTANAHADLTEGGIKRAEEAALSFEEQRSISRRLIDRLLGSGGRK